MNRMRPRLRWAKPGSVRAVASALGLALLLTGGLALAQETTGRVTGRVTDRDSGAAMGGVTVIVQGPQGEDATLTNDKGEYNFTTLPIGTYAIRFYAANTAVQVEQQGVSVSAEQTVRVNAKIAGAAQQAAQQTYVITGRAPTIDVGSARVGATFDQDYTLNVPVGRTFGDVIERAPGAFIDGSGNVSIGGSTGLENQYTINGMNVTGLRYGNVEMGLASHSGGSNLPVEFVGQIEVNSGGYQAEYGGAMGGVINTVLKSGTNEWHGTAFGYWSPYWMAADPKLVLPRGSSLGGVRKPDFDDSIGVEAGGPLIKDKLFLWVGFAPRIADTHVLRETFALQNDGMGMAAVDAAGNPVLNRLDYTARLDETHRTYYTSATLDWVPLPENRLTLAFLTTPSFNTELKNQYGIDPLSSDPRTALESLSKSSTDLSAHWVSKLYERKWQIDALAGMHYEYFYDRSPYDDLNNLNQLQIGGADLWSVERAPGCAPQGSFIPCPIAPYYFGGGFGEIDKSSAYRWSAELKSTNVFEGGGRHEVKYGWHLDFNTLSFDRAYTGPLGGRGFITLPGDGTYSSQTFFQLPNTESPVQYNSGALDATNLTAAPYYVDTLHSYVKSLSNAFFLQDSFSPNHLRNLTINAGVRLELQKIYDSNGHGVFDTNNWSPRLGAIYDPFDDGRSKISVSYGRYYEAIPLDVPARYFAGEQYVTAYGNLNSCAGNLTNSSNWTGAGEYAKCASNSAFATFNTAYAQPNMEGQYHNEIVATVERQVMEDMTVRLDYQHRWLGNIIEDGYGPAFNSVLANPGNVSQSAIDAANSQLAQASAVAAANPNDPVAQANFQTAQANAAALVQLKDAPKPERTYDALTLSMKKRFAKNWYARASYTYSRLIGNYEGLYQYETNYISPNGTNAYDAPELMVNQNGPLPNDRPHLFRLDGYVRQPVRAGHLVFGLSFTARSGQPRNYVGNLEPGSVYQIVMLLPRGEGGRTPTVTQLDAKIGYARPLGPRMNLEAFIDLFNVLNQQTTLQTDDNYTFQAAPPIVNGTPSDLKYAKDLSGAPITKNPNYGQPIAFQTPFNARLGLRLTF
ncbi:MAG TPA: TonB-dependent receptor [Polyangia bacterium]|nr:TonB-dependent receptor [Polyangia bacterium]